jgi:hypothetical protein
MEFGIPGCLLDSMSARISPRLLERGDMADVRRPAGVWTTGNVLRLLLEGLPFSAFTVMNLELGVPWEAFGRRLDGVLWSV